MAERIARFDGVAQPATRPLLRGYSHAFAALAAVAAGIHLAAVESGDDATRLALLVYTASTVMLFATSALYHTVPWPQRTRLWLRRLDHTAIFAIVAGDYTAVAVPLLTGWWRVVLPVGIWALALVGACMVCVRPMLPRPLRAALYVALGVSAIAISPMIMARLDATSLLLLVVSSALGVTGAAIYALQRPRLWPRVFGYHELFHLVVIAATATFYLFVLQQVVPGSPL